MRFGLLLAITACSGGPEIERLERSAAGESVSFAYVVGDAAELSLPDNSRPEGWTNPSGMPVQGPFKLLRTLKGVQTWEAPLPVRSRNLFFSKAPPKMTLHDSSGESWDFVDGRAGDAREKTWDFTAKSLLIRTEKGEGAPEEGALELRYPRATERERALNWDEAGLSESDFVARSVQLHEDTRHGLFLPAPAQISWTVTVPPSGVLDMDAVILPPETQFRHRSDGARLKLEWVANGVTQSLLDEKVEVDSWERIRVDLSNFEGQTGLLRFVSDPGDSPVLDYLFLSDPTLYTPVVDPKRMLLVFIDTLRPDHMGFYGYERDTTPKLDEWSKTAAVFQNARSVAPWTLPSARSAFSGHQPEAWGKVPRLSEYFASSGWATGAFVGNIYLSANFDMSPGWDTYNVVNWPIGEVQADKVRAYMERHSDRDAFMMIHLMDMHLPYTEPKAYQDLWAGDPPAGLSVGSTRRPILNAYRKDKEAVRDWVVGRYDQNMRYLDDVLSDLFDDVGSTTPVLIFSDHGEEFWDHQEFEHGHSLYDELLRVPFVVKAPDLPSGVFDAPVSLLDVAPTCLALAGLPVPSLEGVNLLPAIRGDADATRFLEERLQGFGRPLYGQERWGVLDGHTKWTSHQGREEVYDIAADPLERDDLSGSSDLEERRGAFEKSLDREGGLVWRLAAGSALGGQRKTLVVEVSHPEGFQAAWLGLDPLKRASMKLESRPDGRYRIHFNKGHSGSREVFFLPNGDPLGVEGLTLEVVSGASSGELAPVPALIETLKANGRTQNFVRGRLGNRPIKMTLATSPRPLSDEEFEAFDDEVSEALKALGYVHD